MLRIKKNDIVMVMTGRDKGKTGRVIRIFPEDYRALVENINMVKKAKRRTQQDQKGGIISIESSIHLSNFCYSSSFHRTIIVESKVYLYLIMA